MENRTTGSHEHCFCSQDAIGRPLCCRCMGVLLLDGSVQMLKVVREGIKKGIADVKAGRVKPWPQVKKELGIE